jgi:zinc protease
VYAGQRDYENSGRFMIFVAPRPGASLTEIERLVDSTVTALTSTAPPTAHEVARLKNYVRVNTVMGLDGALNKTNILLDGQVFHGDPLYYVKQTEEALDATPGDLSRVAKHYLTQGRVVLSMVPAGKLTLIAKPDAPYTNVTPKPASAPAAPSPAGH